MTVTIDSAIPLSTDYQGTQSFGNMADIAFALAAYQLTELDADLSMRIDKLEQLTAIKQAYRERILALKDAMKDLEKADDTTWIEHDLATETEYAWNEGEGAVTGSGEKLFGERGVQVSQGEDDGAIIRGETTTEKIEEAEQALADHPEQYDTILVKVNRADIETEIARLEGKMDELSGQGELGLLGINRLLSRRSQTLQLASNVMSTSHTSAMGIIGNIK